MKKDKKKTLIAPVFFLLSVVGIIYCIVVASLIGNISAVDPKDNELQEVTIESGGLRGISKELEEKGIIKDGLAFFLRAQLSGSAGKIGSGTYYLSKDMNVDKIISIVSKGDHDNSQSVTVQIKEGYTIDEIADILYENDVCYDKDAFLELCKTGEGFIGDEKYSYIEELNDEAKYVLEGFLFPDTYEFYYNSRPEDVVTKMLARFNEVYSNEMAMATMQKGYSVKDIITIASIIEKEANNEDFAKVSAVLDNRLKRDMYLQCDSTIRYVVNDSNTISLSKEQYNYNSKYNSYENRGLVPSPICNPSLAAIEAALNPDQDFVNEEYLYFCSTDANSKALVFAKTYQEHLENVKRYSDDWKTYDDTVKSN